MPHCRCILTGDPLFNRSFPHALEDSGLVYCVRGSYHLESISEEEFRLSPMGELPVNAVDVVRWAGLKQIQLDKPGFVRHWHRYVNRLLGADTSSTAEHIELLERSQLFARRMLHRFDELDFLVGRSEASHGAIAVLHFRDDGLTPYIYFLAVGVEDAHGAPAREVRAGCGHS